MKLKSLLSVAAVAATISASAQTWVKDSVTMGAGYANDSYYSLKNGEQKNIANNTWHLAFQTTPQGPYGNVSVWANHTQAAVKVIPLHKSASANFATITAADTVGKMPVYNTDTSWNYGAFNRATGTTPFDFSWGVYDMTSHNVNGDSTYLLHIGTSNPVDYKLWIKTYVSFPTDSVKWIFRIAKLDGTDDTTITIRPSAYPNRMFAYYNVTSKSVSDREPSRFAWDILFTRYSSLQFQGPVAAQYNVTGVLSNFGVSVADVRNVNPDTAMMQNYTMTKNISEIGSDWKSFNMTTNSYNVDTTATFFIKTNNTNEYYQLKFTAFDYLVGKSVFYKKFLGAVPTSVHGVNNAVTNYYVTPVPATNVVTLMMDAKLASSDAKLLLTDMNGRTVLNTTVNINAGMNAFNVPVTNFPAGLYLLHVAGDNVKLSAKITVAH